MSHPCQVILISTVKVVARSEHQTPNYICEPKQIYQTVIFHCAVMTVHTTCLQNSPDVIAYKCF